MSSHVDEAAIVYGPIPGGTTARTPQRLADSGTTESSPTVGLVAGAHATILNGPEPIRFTLRGASGVATAVATTDPIIGPYGRFDWLVQDETAFPHVEAADGSADYECWVFTSGSGLK